MGWFRKDSLWKLKRLDKMKNEMGVANNTKGFDLSIGLRYGTHLGVPSGSAGTDSGAESSSGAAGTDLGTESEACSGAFGTDSGAESGVPMWSSRT